MLVARLELSVLGLDVPRELGNDLVNLSQTVKGSKLSNLVQVCSKHLELPIHLHEFLVIIYPPQVDILEII